MLLEGKKWQALLLYWQQIPSLVHNTKNKQKLHPFLLEIVFIDL